MSLLRRTLRGRDRRGAQCDGADGSARLVESAHAPQPCSGLVTDRLSVPGPGVFTPSRWRSIEPIIDAALELSKDERDAYVQAACGSDASLRAEVEELLAAHDASTADVDTPAAAQFASLLDAEQPRLPEVIGDRYKIGPMLGRGGMATVFLADDLRHERQVAV